MEEAFLGHGGCHGGGLFVREEVCGFGRCYEMIFEGCRSGLESGGEGGQCYWSSL